MIFYSLYMTQQ